MGDNRPKYAKTKQNGNSVSKWQNEVDPSQTTSNIIFVNIKITMNCMHQCSHFISFIQLVWGFRHHKSLRTIIWTSPPSSTISLVTVCDLLKVLFILIILGHRPLLEGGSFDEF